LLKKFLNIEKAGFYAIRTPGSGSGKMAKPDLIAVDNGNLLAIEVKSTRKDYIMLNKEQIKRIKEFCEKFIVKCPHCGKEFSPKPVLAARFLNREWKFLEIPMELEDSLIIKANKKIKKT
ncbi:MAG: Holliday junction resolvase Hjc, partial [Nitrososphaerota archaeon]